MQPEHFFISTPFVRWTLVPLLLLFAVGLPLMTDEWTTETTLIVSVLSCSALLYALALLFPERMQWGGRVVAGFVFLAYTCYLVYELAFSGQPFSFTGRRSDASPRNALLGYFVIGLPALAYAVRGPRPFGANEDAEE